MMGALRHGWAALVVVLAMAGASAAQDVLGQAPGVRATLAAEGTGLRATWSGAEVTLALSQPVPFRAHVLDDPRRLVLDFREVDFASLPRDVLRAALVDGARVTGLRAGALQAGWSRMVLDLGRPLLIETAALDTGAGPGGARLRVVLRRAAPQDFAAAAGPVLSGLFPDDVAPAPPVADTGRAGQGLRILLDPGHGGIDPGAVVGEVHEADIVLSFARAAREVLRRRGHTVILSRDTDRFVSLEARIAAARHAGADLMISLHADALAEGQATGAQVYTLAPEASSRASELLAERHNRDDLLGGVDLTRQDDAIATTLMEIARRETVPRADALAASLIDAFRAHGVPLHKRPREAGAFAVLKAPDIPSVLLELGFMSSPGDLARLVDPAWRAQVAQALAEGVDSWRARDATLRALRRQ